MGIVVQWRIKSVFAFFDKIIIADTKCFVNGFLVDKK